MRKLYLFIAIGLMPFWAIAQKTIVATGNWNSPSTWQGGTAGDIATTLADDVVMNDGFSVTVANTDNFHVGNLTAGNTNTLVVANGGNLELGDASNPRDLTAGSDMTISATGDLIIWGNLLVNSSNLTLTITVPGHIIVKGDLIVADHASFTVNGDLEVDGAFTGGDFTNVTVNGNIFVYGPTTVGASSNVIGGGHFHTYGGCSGPSSFCNTSPVELIYFNGEAMTDQVQLSWATASELNFDYFLVEKSTDGKIFNELGTVTGHGTSTVKNSYSLDDRDPHIGRTYYRLTEVDMDHTKSQLRWIAVDYTGDRGVSLFPNPATGGKVTVRLNFVPKGPVAITVLDLRGVVLSEFTVHEIETEVPVQPTVGTYLVRLNSTEFNSVQRLIVR